MHHQSLSLTKRKQDLYGQADLADYCGTCENSIQYWRKKGYIPQPTIVIGSRLHWTKEQADAIAAYAELRRTSRRGIVKDES